MIKNEENAEKKALLNLEEFCAYLGIGESMARKMIREPKNNFGLRIGNRLYANRKKLNEWLDRQCE